MRPSAREWGAQAGQLQQPEQRPPSFSKHKVTPLGDRRAVNDSNEFNQQRCVMLLRSSLWPVTEQILARFSRRFFECTLGYTVTGVFWREDDRLGREGTLTLICVLRRYFQHFIQGSCKQKKLCSQHSSLRRAAKSGPRAATRRLQRSNVVRTRVLRGALYNLIVGVLDQAVILVAYGPFTQGNSGRHAAGHWSVLQGRVVLAAFIAAGPAAAGTPHCG